MSVLRYWTGTDWAIVPTQTGGGGGGTQGPPGADGKSVNVYGPQATQPIPERKGDMWLTSAVLRSEAPQVTGLVAHSVPEPAYLVHSPNPYPTLQR